MFPLRLQEVQSNWSMMGAHGWSLTDSFCAVWVDALESFHPAGWAFLEVFGARVRGLLLEPSWLLEEEFLSDSPGCWATGFELVIQPERVLKEEVC